MAILVEQLIGDAWVEIARYTREFDGENYRLGARGYARAVSYNLRALIRTRLEGSDSVLDIFKDGLPPPPT